MTELRELAAVLVVTIGCASNTDYVPPAAPQVTCTSTSPCDLVRRWVGVEVDFSQRQASCHATLIASACSQLDRESTASHAGFIENFSMLCQGSFGRTSAAVYPDFGQPDQDRQDYCGRGTCRFWSWKWDADWQGDSFTLTFTRKYGATDWILENCAFCSAAGCREMPFKP